MLQHTRGEARPRGKLASAAAPEAAGGVLPVTVCVSASGLDQMAAPVCPVQLGPVGLPQQRGPERPQQACAHPQLPSEPARRPSEHRCLTFMARRGSTETSACQQLIIRAAATQPKQQQQPATDAKWPEEWEPRWPRWPRCSTRGAKTPAHA